MKKWGGYSENEEKIGTFLGKDLYRRVYKPTNLYTSATQNTITKYPVTAITGTVTDIRVIAKRGTGSVQFYLCECLYYSTSNEIGFSQRITNEALPILAIVIEYTKTAI